MGKTIGIIQARMGSSRLPGKILSPLADRPLLDQLFRRISRSQIEQWWLATSSDPSDDVTEAWGFELGLRVFRGDADDVLSRFVAIGTETRADSILRVIADNAFLDAPLIDALLDARDGSSGAKRASVIQHRGGLSPDGEDGENGLGSEARPLSPELPIGYSVELIRHQALARAAAEIPRRAKHHRVHVTSWFAARGQVFDVPTPCDWPSRPNWRWTLDTYEDLAMARSAFRLFGAEAGTIDYPAMVAKLDAHPEITAMNAHVAEKALEEG